MQDKEREIIGAQIVKGKYVFLRNNHTEGYLEAKWQGEYHLAYVDRGWDEDTNEFTVLWRRSKGTDLTTYTLEDNKQIFHMEESSNVHVENDYNSQCDPAITVSTSQREPGKVRIRWDRGDYCDVYASQIFFGLKPRKRDRIQTAPKLCGSAKRGVSEEKKAHKKCKTLREKQPTDTVVVAAAIGKCGLEKDDESNDDEGLKPTVPERDGILLHGFSCSKMKDTQESQLTMIQSVLENAKCFDKNSKGTFECYS